jgi:hypothetical protein
MVILELAQMNTSKIQEILDQADANPKTRELVDRLIDTLLRVLSDYDLDQAIDILARSDELAPELGVRGDIVLIPGEGAGRCAPVVLAITKGRGGRSRYGLSNVMRAVRAHLIQCFEIAEVIILLSDRWDPDIMKESEADFLAHASRSIGRKVFIPVVYWKHNLTIYDWPQ